MLCRLRHGFDPRNQKGHVVGQAKEIRDDDTLVFGVYKMVKTR
ncbi:hypothetical protein J2Z49_001165 [Desulfofundulus luciae]|uniref:Uncharacterized protein n=1 Tax=Desulfofundulus luciae TaxID=74702 RepID=A0ABU0B1C7_9FIRM|nr:hypothetical protein [Desulfofundulus luciae]MDQ0286059.1 hypothetical protein [Desulfofundulus luciae]